MADNRTAESSAGVDRHTPNAARMYDYYLGGKNHFGVDRVAAEKVIAAVPGVVEGARANRAFLGRAVAHLAEQGISQFLDLGSGLPTQDSVHQVAQRWTPDARTVYVDNDPVVLTHARALLCTDQRTHTIAGDLRRPDDVLAEVDRHALLDLSRPVAVLMVAVLHFVPSDAKAADIVAGYRGAVAEGSFVAISHSTGDFNDPDDVRRALAVYRKAGITVTPRSKQRVQRLFAGWELTPPGLVDVRDWHAPIRHVGGPTTFYGGLGRKGAVAHGGDAR